MADWKYDVVSIGYPGPVLRNRPVSEPWNLGKGWGGFNFEAAFKCPVKVLNDAAMQALGSYKRGKMLFLGLGTGLGSALLWDRTVLSLELSDLPYIDNQTVEDQLGDAGRERLAAALLRIEACGICGSDYEQYDGAQPPHEDYTSFPVVPGHEPLGRIEEIGARAKQRWGVTEGDRVAVRVAHADGRDEAIAFRQLSAGSHDEMHDAVLRLDVLAGSGEAQRLLALPRAQLFPPALALLRPDGPSSGAAWPGQRRCRPRPARE